MIRRYGDAPEPARRYTLRPGAYAILPRDGALLVTHQSEPWPEFQLPGGGIDPGESPVQALHREVYEETGWHIARAQRLGAFRRFTYMPEYDLWAEKLCIIYAALPVRPHGAPLELGHSVRWMAPMVAAELLGNPGDRDFVRRHAV
ncbi:NUDIX hydrolase [Citreicella sp. C3M06]|uniref:NUDIX domain-containing protein n=1 Tax=Citreicella sp. C3M06 TaxID=2841564 RepID=UPI001C08896C|nr:NUDIX hydrolase [Citreicella sp. C3M06]MBU2960647.1 NUDIX hydrolase [Citreicella sp. C3M06]